MFYTDNVFQQYFQGKRIMTGLFLVSFSFQAVYIAPLKALVRERMDDWKVRFQQKLGRR